MNYESQKSAFVALVGRPNVGKSTLLNRFIGEKVAIVTPKPQTTRTRITGILTEGELQLVFFDTPGIHRPKTKLSEYMVKQVRESVSDVDIAVLVVEPTGPVNESERELIARFAEKKMPALLAVNKIDSLAQKELMMEKIAVLSELYPFVEIVPVSAQTGDGCDLLLDKIKSYAKEGPHFFDDDAYTDQPERVLVAEMVREKLLYYMRDEIPHGIAVVTEQMKERAEQDIVDLSVVIYCEKDSHKGMVIGKKGAMLKKVASEARLDMEQLLGVKVNLQCWVKVKGDWRNREGLMRNFGFQ